MGFGPHELDQWEPWQFRAAWNGWKATKVAPTVRPPSDAEFQAALDADARRALH